MTKKEKSRKFREKLKKILGKRRLEEQKKLIKNNEMFGGNNEQKKFLKKLKNVV